MNFIKRHLFSSILLLLLAALFLVPNFRAFVQSQFLMKASVEPSEAPTALGSEDWDLSLKGLNTPDARLSDFKNKGIFLNFWATWCPPCRAEWPSIEALYLKNKTQVHFVLIAMQDQEENIKKFLAENNYTAPVYIANSPLSPRLLPKSFPTTFVINSQGQVVKQEERALDWDSPETEVFIKKL